MKNLLSVREVASLLGTTNRDVYQLVSDGKLPAVQQEGHVLVHQSDLPPTVRRSVRAGGGEEPSLDLVRGHRGDDVKELDDKVEGHLAKKEPRMRLSEEVAVREAVRKLNPNLAEALTLYEEGYRSEEIAARLGVAPGTVGQWLIDARRALADILG